MRNCLILLFCFLLWTNCYVANSQTIKTSEWFNLTTSGKLPPQCKIQKSNNNLDVVQFKGRFYLAFRTAPSHFPSGKAVLYIVSSTDLNEWQFEKEVKLHADLREPRFAVYRDTLNLYFFTGSKSMFKFDPREILLCRTTGNGRWTVPVNINLDGYVPWRIRERNDTLYLSAYYGKGLYKGNHRSDLRLFSSTNSVAWQAISVQPQIDLPHAEEGEFVFDKDGNLFATVRLEGTGALVCTADKCCITEWNHVRTKHKYDSALLFEHHNEIFLVSRRNLDGEMDKVKNRKNEKQGRVRNLIRYSITPKVTALFKLNKETLTLTHLLDFPSTGDNAFPAIAPLNDGSYLLMNYSSNINGKKKTWIAGQLGKTFIYQTVLRVE